MAKKPIILSDGISALPNDIGRIFVPAAEERSLIECLRRAVCFQGPSPQEESRRRVFDRSHHNTRGMRAMMWGLRLLSLFPSSRRASLASRR
jgi:hypothetical protein